MIICAPADGSGQIDPRWGRAARVAVADVRDGGVARWEEFDVGWDRLHDAASEGGHHARVARFRREHLVEAVLAHHMGDPMRLMLVEMGVEVHLGVSGPARLAAVSYGSLAAPLRRSSTGRPPRPN